MIFLKKTKKMNESLLYLNPKSVWKNFVELTKIPRPSKKETLVVEFMKKWAKELNLEIIVDEVENVIIRKPATPGYENRKTVILQGHLDMVPQKNSDKVHDFEKDPITAWIDGDWVKADGTTLGADNGIGVALAMAILESKDIPHPPIEALFTVDEETGMTGAFGLKPGILKGDILINLDSEEEGALCIGCAGGINANIVYYYETEKPAENSTAYKVTIKGLKGGHSGVDIHLQRGNACKLMFRFLYNANKLFNIELSSFEVGNMRNAIPREGWAIVSVPNNRTAEFEALIAQYSQIFTREYKDSEDNLQFFAEKTDNPAFVIDSPTKDALIQAIEATPNGVIRMELAMPNLVETSTNLSIVKLTEEKIEVIALIRSSVDTAKQDVVDTFEAIYNLSQADEVYFDGTYPGWKPEPNYDIVKIMEQTYKKMFNKEPHVYAIHAGLECGLFLGVYPHLEAISIGPDIRFPHSPDEKLNIQSVEKVWNFLVEVLKNTPAK